MENAKREIEEHPRKCKTCGTGIRKGKQYCERCRGERSRARWRIHSRIRHKKNFIPSKTWSCKINFKRDEEGNVLEKLCTTCKEWKPASEFHKRKDTASGLRSFCKPCEGERAKAKPYKPSRKNWSPLFFHECHCKNHFSSNRKNAKHCSKKCETEWHRIKSRIKEVYSMSEKNGVDAFFEWKCKKCEEVKPWGMFGVKSILHHNGRPRLCDQCREYLDKEAIKKYRRKRMQNPTNRVRHNLSKRLQQIMRSNGRSKDSINTAQALGCSVDFLRRHIESQFTRGMTWENYGSFWQVDHIQPCASFDHSDDEQIKKCWHFSNLQPLRSEENNTKADSIIDCQPELMLGMH